MIIKKPRSKDIFKGNIFSMPSFLKSTKEANTRYKMNEIVNTFLSAGDKPMPEMNLRQPAFTYSACRPFTKKQRKMKKSKETGDSQYIYQTR